MTLYSYKCPDHGVLDIRHPMAEVNSPHACPQCGAVMKRVPLPITHRWPSNHRPGFEESGNRMLLDLEFQARMKDKNAQTKEEHVNRTAKEAAQ